MGTDKTRAEAVLVIAITILFGIWLLHLAVSQNTNNPDIVVTNEKTITIEENDVNKMTYDEAIDQQNVDTDARISVTGEV